MTKTRSLGRWLAFVLLAVVAFTTARAEEVMPPKPTRYFNDGAGVVRPETVARLNGELENLEKQSSNQILVCIYPKMQTDSSIEDYCHRIYAGWGVGQKGKNNGAVLFVFVQDHKMRIETGRGLEGALPDSTCEDIISDVIEPKLKANDFDGGLTAGVEAMIQATKGEYKGNGHTADEANGGSGGSIGVGGVVLLVGAFGIIVMLSFLFPGFFGGLLTILNILSLFGGRGGGTTFGGGSSGGGGGWSSGGGDSGAGGGASGSW